MIKKKITDIVIIGGGYPDLFDIIEDINSYNKTYNIIGVVDEKRYKNITRFSYKLYKNFSTIKFKNNKNLYLVNGVASSIKSREEVFKFYNKKKFKFINLIHPNSKINNLKLKQGNIVCSGVYFGRGTEIGCNNLFSPNVYIGHDTKIKDNCFFGPMASILGKVKINKNCYLGSGCKILNEINIDRNSHVSLGAVVFNDVGVNKKIFGNPGREV